MASTNIIKLLFQTFANTSGYDKLTNATKSAMGNMSAMSKASRILGMSMGMAGAAIGKVVGGLLQGGVWSVAAEGVKALIGKVKDFKEQAIKELSAVGDGFKAPIVAAERLQAALKADMASIRIERERISVAEKSAEVLTLQAKALAELNRQRRIAAGEDAGIVNEDIDARLASIDTAATRRAGDADVAAAAKAAQEADVNLKSARAGVDKARKELAKLQEERFQRANALWVGENLFAARNGFSLGRENETSFMSDREDEEYAKKKEEISAKIKEIASLELGVRDAEAKAANAAESHNAALVRRKTIEVNIESERIKADNEREAAEKAAREKAEEDAAEQERLKMEREIAAGRALQKLHEEEAKKEEEAERKLQEQKEKDRLDALRKDKDANTERANDLRAKLKSAQEDVATAAAQFRDPKQIDIAAERKAKRQENIDSTRLALNAIKLQERNPNWRNARNLSRQDEATRRWLLAKENENKVKNEQKEVVDKLDKIKTLLEAATTL
ncbi:MAG: hypothetical protein IJI35_05860 [Kiritimatiellae bacterium]|nr:hypothetical protein [Kiritimatiellia bacterium]